MIFFRCTGVFLDPKAIEFGREAGERCQGRSVSLITMTTSSDYLQCECRQLTHDLTNLKRPWTFFLRVGIENVENQTFSLLIFDLYLLKIQRYQANHRILAEFNNIRPAPRNGLLVT